MEDGRIGVAEPDRAPSAVTLAGIYRRRNTQQVEKLVEAARSAGWTVAWWALDEASDELAESTVGVGPGARLPLLNAVVSRAGIEAGWLVVSDDDVEFTRGNLVDLVRLCAQAEFDLAQPARSAHAPDDADVAHPITVARRISRARTTTFVEIGPLFVVGPRWWSRIVPFPEEREMGWGLELDWYELQRQGCRLGIVDAVRVAHLGERGSDYDFELHVRRVHDELEARGFDGWKAVQRTLGVWRPWQSVPPWSGASPRGH